MNKYIPSIVTNFSSMVDKERIVLFWDSVEKVLSFKSLLVKDETTHWDVYVGTDVLTSADKTSFTIASAGASSTDDIYADNNIIFLTGDDRITRIKNIDNYVGSSKTFNIDAVEYDINIGDKFAFATAKNLIDDTSIYVDSTLTDIDAGTAFNVTAFDTTTKIFSVENNSKETVPVAFALAPGEDFTLNTAHYPILYKSVDGGSTYDSGTNLSYTVSNVPSVNNTWIVSTSSLLEVNDPNFYIGSYITFLSGENKGFSRKITDFDIYTRDITTDYFEYDIAQNDVFTINTISFRRTSGIEDIRYKIVLWNNNGGDPIYSEPAYSKPLVSLKNTLDTLDNGYWNTEINTNLYVIEQGISKEGQSLSEDEAYKQNQDMDIINVRDEKLYQNFGINYELLKNENITYDEYRNRIVDLISAFKYTSSYEGLYQIGRSFNRITPTVKVLLDSGWRCDVERMGDLGVPALTSTTIPYSLLGFLFGVQIIIYGVFLDSTDVADVERLTIKNIPLHVFPNITYSVDFFGETSFWGFDGTMVNLALNDRYKTLRPTNIELISEDNITTTVQTVTDNTTFTGADTLTYKKNYYKDKNIKFTTGLNAGISRQVLSYNGGTKEFVTDEFPYTVAVTDTFQLEKIEYQTKYTTETIDLGVTDFFDLEYPTSWFVRKLLDKEIVESIYMLFSDDDISYTIEREVNQNEIMNPASYGEITVGDGSAPYNSFTATASTGSSLDTETGHYIDSNVKFITGANSGEIKKILTYNASTGEFTTENFTLAVAIGDTFSIMNTEIKRYCKFIAYHNNLKNIDDIEIESLVLKKG